MVFWRMSLTTDTSDEGHSPYVSPPQNESGAVYAQRFECRFLLAHHHGVFTWRGADCETLREVVIKLVSPCAFVAKPKISIGRADLRRTLTEPAFIGRQHELVAMRQW